MVFDDRVERLLDRVADENRDVVDQIGKSVTITNRVITGYTDYDDPEFDTETVEARAEVTRSVDDQTFQRTDAGIQTDADIAFVVPDTVDVYDGDEGDDADGNPRAPSRIEYDGETYDVLDVHDRDDGGVVIHCD